MSQVVSGRWHAELPKPRWSYFRVREGVVADIREARKVHVCSVTTPLHYVERRERYVTSSSVHAGSLCIDHALEKGVIEEVFDLGKR